jgi:hypothetical protein
MPQVTIGVQWRRQEDSYLCGPAVAQMILESLNTSPPATPPTWQMQLWETIKTKTTATGSAATKGKPSASGFECPSFPSQRCEKWCGAKQRCWCAWPNALARVLNASGTTTPVAAVKKLSSEVTATAALIASIDDGRACAALFLGWQHWVVLGGYLHDDSGTNWPAVSIGGQNINALLVLDPDNSRGQRFMPCKAWFENFSVVPCGSLANNYVVVVPKASNSSTPVHSNAIGALTAPPIGAPLVPRVEALGTASLAVRELVKSMKRWEAAFDGATASTPLLVRRLDATDAYFYVVPFQSAGKITGRALVDARTGQFMEAGGIMEAGQGLSPYVDPTETLRRYNAAALGALSHLKLFFRPETASVGEVLVWKPCDESLTPYLPFYTITVGDQVVYLRVDGQVFTKLHSIAPARRGSINGRGPRRNPLRTGR